jgi:hypothetical protein
MIRSYRMCPYTVGWEVNYVVKTFFAFIFNSTIDLNNDDNTLFETPEPFTHRRFVT